MHICRFSPRFKYSNKNDISLNSQMNILYNDMYYENVGNELDIYAQHKILKVVIFNRSF